jgi:hypothetical protein
MTFAIIVNKPGYQPDNDDPSTADDLDAARNLLMEELGRTYTLFVDDGSTEAERARHLAMQAAAEAQPRDSVALGGYVHTIVEAADEPEEVEWVVSWTIDITARDPVTAAHMAFELMQNVNPKLPDSATCFYVQRRGQEGETIDIHEEPTCPSSAST